MLFGNNPSENLEFTETKKSPWVPSYSGEIGIGYSDNPLYGSFVRQDTSFWKPRLKLFSSGMSQEYLTYFYLFGEGKRYDALEDNQDTLFFLLNWNMLILPSNRPILMDYACVTSIMIKVLIFQNLDFLTP